MARPSTLALSVLAAAAALVVAAARCREPTSAGNASLATTITAADVRRWVYRLADDSMRGRRTPSPELDSAAATIAAYFEQLGLVPAFPGGRFVDRYPVPPKSSGADSAPNVAAVLQGSDPRLGAEYLVIVAHVDGKGVRIPVGSDSIYNGADDNASGTAGVLELAEAFAGTAPRPRRSLVFLIVSGEEKGLWGSQWYVYSPGVPLSAIVGVVDLDMIGRNAPDSLQLGGTTLSTLGYLASEAADAHPELGLPFISPGPEAGSDFVPFWQQGIPWVLFFTGLHPDYHTPADEPDRVDADKAARVTQLAFYTVLAVADADARPQWVTRTAPPAGAGPPAP